MNKFKSFVSMSLVLLVMLASMAVFAEDENVDPKEVILPPSAVEII